MGDWPIKICDYCKNEGRAYTFLHNETICPKCFVSFKSEPKDLRMAVYRLHTVLRGLVEKIDKIKTQVSRIVNGEISPNSGYRGQCCQGNDLAEELEKDIDNYEKIAKDAMEIVCEAEDIAAAEMEVWCGSDKTLSMQPIRAIP